MFKSRQPEWRNHACTSLSRKLGLTPGPHRTDSVADNEVVQLERPSEAVLRWRRDGVSVRSAPGLGVCFADSTWSEVKGQPGQGEATASTGEAPRRTG